MGRKFIRRTIIAAPAELLFAWHKNPAAFGRLEPPFQKVEVIEKHGGIEDGATVTIALPSGPFKIIWKLAHKDYQEGRQFTDYQIKGPFKSWTHTHKFLPAENNQSILEDCIEYELPFGALSEIFFGGYFEDQFDRLFRYRHAVTAHDLQLLNRDKGQNEMRIAITGASGLIGKSLVNLLSGQGHEVFKLTRHKSSDAHEIQWDPNSGTLDPNALEGMDAVVHLAGESVGQVWTKEIKQRIRESREKGTTLIARTIANLQKKPAVFISASAIGYYGDRGDEPLNESSSVGRGFLAEVVKDWETATAAASSAGIRTVNMRFGVVLSPEGGALKQMLPPFQMGAGGNLGHGRQYFSWISLTDAVNAIRFAIETPSLQGPVNVVSPNPVTNAEFTRALGKVLSRPTIFPVPAMAARMIFGEMADEMLLGGARIFPQKLQQAGYPYQFPTIEAALRHELGK